MPTIRTYMTQELLDDHLKIAMGVYPDIPVVNKFGHNPAVASGGTEEIWEGSALYVFPASALMVKLSQTTDQAAMQGETVRIVGLDNDFAEVTQDVVLDASNTTTPVVLGTALRRVQSMLLRSTVVADQPIRLHNSAEDKDYSVIAVPDGHSESAIYTVPAGFTAYITRYYASHLPTSGQTFTSCNIKLLCRDNINGFAPFMAHENGFAPDGSFDHHFDEYFQVTEQEDIYLQATTVGAAADVVGGFDLLLVRN